MKPAFIISMYDEHAFVKQSIDRIVKVFPDSTIVVVHSHNGMDFAYDGSKNIHYLKLSDLAKTVSRYSLPSSAICRNFSAGFLRLYEIEADHDLIVALTGDTLVTDAASFNRRLLDLRSRDKSAAVSQAVGQLFHADSDNPELGIVGGRPQNEDTTDFACCLFMILGDVARAKGAFTDIKITNQYTSEQCLGDELMRVLDVYNGQDFHSKVIRLNEKFPREAYSYSDGITYHARTNGAPGR